MEIQIKEFAKENYSEAIGFAIEGMHFNRYMDNKLTLRLYGRYFLYLELERATQALAAYMGDRLVGVLLADMKNEPKLHSSFWRRFYVRIATAVMAALVKGGPDIYDEANKMMFTEYLKKSNPDGEICFLATDCAVQGRGIGTLLLKELSKREKGKLIYLYTDTNCTYQFYEHRGFERAEEKIIKMEIGAKTVPLTCLLYSKQL